MPIIAMFIPSDRVSAAHVELPREWQLRFLETKDESKIIEACQDADCIVSTGPVT